MKQKRLLFPIVLTAVLAAGALSFNSSDRVTIYHYEGNGSWSTRTISRSALNGHAGHEGDRWWRTQCPLSGPEDC
jgi:hypothetical protein